MFGWFLFWESRREGKREGCGVLVWVFVFLGRFICFGVVFVVVVVSFLVFLFVLWIFHGVLGVCLFFLCFLIFLCWLWGVFWSGIGGIFLIFLDTAQQPVSLKTANLRDHSYFS